MDYPHSERKSTSVRIKKGLLEAIEMFLKPEKARFGGFEYRTDVANAAVRQLLEKYGFPLEDYDEEKNEEQSQ